MGRAATTPQDTKDELNDLIVGLLLGLSTPFDQTQIYNLFDDVDKVRHVKAIRITVLQVPEPVPLSIQLLNDLDRGREGSFFQAEFDKFP